MSGPDFEKLVRRFARIRWDLPEGEGGSNYVNGQEFDAICRTEDNVHLVMCTVDRTLRKVQSDVEKLNSARDYLFQSERANVVCWMITKEEPSPDQRKCADKVKVKIQSLSEFQRKFLDVKEYFERRRAYHFGSATDPSDDKKSLPVNEYVHCNFSDENGREQSVASLSRLLEQRSVAVLTADFGAGKSLTLREVFFQLCDRYENANEKFVPIAINLREHWGQTSVAEVLERHARSIGMQQPHQLVRVWNAGSAIVLLDGFDELAIQPLMSTDRQRHEARRAATEIIRQFVDHGRGKCGILIAGRAQYFDSTAEQHSSLNTRSSDLLLSLSPFTDDQATEYLKKKGVDTGLPSWLPRSPLLLGYLAHRRLLSELSDINDQESQFLAWDSFLDRIFTREAALSREYDSSTIRRLMEKLATRTRLVVGGTRDLDDQDLAIAFKEVTRQSAYDATHVMLQRLPGLTSRLAESGRRSFVESHLLQVLRGSDFRFFVENPYQQFSSGPLQHPLERFAAEAAATLIGKANVSISLHLVAARESVNRHKDPTLAADCIVTAGLRSNDSAFDCEGLVVHGSDIDEFDPIELGLSNLTLQSCSIRRLVVEGIPDRIHISGCMIGEIDGVMSADGLPTWVTEPDVGTFSSSSTTDALLSLHVSLPEKVGFTILKKLYMQRGSGRQESALHRGLDQKSRECVGKVLAVLSSEGFAVRSQTGTKVIWHPAPQSRNRVLQLLAAPAASTDSLLGVLRALK